MAEVASSDTRRLVHCGIVMACGAAPSMILLVASHGRRWRAFAHHDGVVSVDAATGFLPRRDDFIHYDATITAPTAGT
jgi:hypothetical protein